MLKDAVRLHKALSDPNRIRIIKMLQIRSLCVCEITSILELATSTVSKHLQILRNANLIADFKEGKWVNFRLNEDGIDSEAAAVLSQLSDSLQDDRQIADDAERVNAVDRYEICGIG